MAVHWTEFPERVEKFGDLFNILETLDRDYPDVHFESFAKETEQSAYEVMPNGPVYRFVPRPERMPGLERLLTRLEREGFSIELSVNLLRKIRGRVLAARHIDRSAVNDMTIVEVADVLDETDGKTPPAPSAPTPPASRQITLGQLIQWLDDLAVHSAGVRWQPDENEMPGIRRLELLCDLEQGDAGINAAKVRRLRARICRQQQWQPQHADQLSVTEAADVLDEVQHVSLTEFQQVGQDAAHHGLTALDFIDIYPGRGGRVQVTGLSCKVVAGTTPTACPDASPVLPPSMLHLAEQAIRRLYPLPPGTTIHWLGHDTGMRSRCRCHPDAPFAAPFDQPRWAAFVGQSQQHEPATPSPEIEQHEPEIEQHGEDLGAFELPTQSEPEPYRLRPSGSVWEIQGCGETGHLPDMLGVNNLVQLLRQPGQYVSWAELLALPAVNDSRSNQPAQTPEGVRKIKDERRRLQGEIDEADNEAGKADSERRLSELNEQALTGC